MLLLKNRGGGDYRKSPVEECFVGLQITCYYEAVPRVSSSLRFKTKERNISVLELFPK